MVRARRSEGWDRRSAVSARHGLRALAAGAGVCRPAPAACRRGPAVLSTPIGPLTLEAGDRGLRTVWFGERSPATDAPRGEHPILEATRDQLLEYFAGRRQAFAHRVLGTPAQGAHMCFAPIDAALAALGARLASGGLIREGRPGQVGVF